MKRVAVASHVALVNGKEYDGVGNVMMQTLKSITDSFIFVRHSIDGLLGSEVHYYDKSSIKTKDALNVYRKIAPFRYVMEVIKTVQYFSKTKNIDVYIGIDPLNALAGVVLKKKRIIEKAIFFTSDYSDSRFDSKFMSRIYHWIDAYCVKNADEVWSVSSEIVKIRKGMGLADDKNVFLPNVPPIEFNNFRKNKHDIYNLITYGIIDKQLDFDGTIRAVKELKKDFPKISFTIIGNGPEEARLISLAKKLKVSDRIHFLGRKPLEQTLEIASKSGVGLALYTGVWGFNKYGDSTKCREYFNYGLPVLSTDTHSTVGDISSSGAGLIVEKRVESYVAAIKDIINNYEEFSKKSLAIGKKYQGAHRKELLRVLGA